MFLLEAAKQCPLCVFPSPALQVYTLNINCECETQEAGGAHTGPVRFNRGERTQVWNHRGSHLEFNSLHLEFNSLLSPDLSLGPELHRNSDGGKNSSFLQVWDSAVPRPLDGVLGGHL